MTSFWKSARKMRVEVVVGSQRRSGGWWSRRLDPYSGVLLERTH
jgi:hypothetical protein